MMWVLLAGVRAFTTCIDIFFQSLLGRDLVITEQDVRLRELPKDLRSMVNISMIEDGMDHLVDENGNTVTASDTVKEGTLVVREKDVLELLEDSSMQMEQDLVSLSHKDRRDVCTTLEKLFPTAYVKISTMQAERDSSNARSARSLPPILPYQLASLRPREFLTL